MATVMPSYRKARGRIWKIYRTASLILVVSKVMDDLLVILSAITWSVQGIRPSQHRFRKDGSCLSNLISFYDQMTYLVDEERFWM